MNTTASLSAKSSTENSAVPLAKQLEQLREKKAAMDEERAVLFRLFRRGGIKEHDLARQLAEMTGEEDAHGSVFGCVVENVEDEMNVFATAVFRLGAVILRIPKSPNGPLG